MMCAASELETIMFHLTDAQSGWKLTAKVSVDSNALTLLASEDGSQESSTNSDDSDTSCSPEFDAR